MFRFFENLVDPFEPYEQDDTPPTKLWPFLNRYLKPFRAVFFWATVSSIIVASIELWLIAYVGRIVDALGETTVEAFWGEYGLELSLVAIFVLFILC